MRRTKTQKENRWVVIALVLGMLLFLFTPGLLYTIWKVDLKIFDILYIAFYLLLIPVFVILWVFQIREIKNWSKRPITLLLLELGKPPLELFYAAIYFVVALIWVLTLLSISEKTLINFFLPFSIANIAVFYLIRGWFKQEICEDGLYSLSGIIKWEEIEVYWWEKEIFGTQLVISLKNGKKKYWHIPTTKKPAAEEVLSRFIFPLTIER